jgi:hypothetical protein
MCERVERRALLLGFLWRGAALVHGRPGPQLIGLAVAKRLGGTPMAVALSWLLQHSPNIMLIPGTSLVGHLRENVARAAWPCRPTPPPSWTRSEQWTPVQRIGSAVLRSRESP